ncbi:hypothetical protein OPV22_008505 [Ensete ventricosum]|uniref:Uncharacterized protein n=1 Tax=Ensete ventricosum TaxID=4639 RepID=A0AAV8RGP1_ENSVE|nr:hypothetical protein OPV22_008505 [Ensete ventricosum]
MLGPLGWLVVFAGPSNDGALPRRNHLAQGIADVPWRSCVPVYPVFFWQIYEFVVFLMVSLDPFSGAYDNVSWIRSSVDDYSCSMDFVDRTEGADDFFHLGSIDSLCASGGDLIGV